MRRNRRKKQLSYWQAVAIYSAAGLVFGILAGLLVVRLIAVALQIPFDNSKIEIPLKQYDIPVVRAAAEVVEEAPEEIGPQFICLGEFRITAYCPCMKCCGKTDGITATGTQATQGRTIAVDPDVIPYGTTVYIDGAPYVAEDCGGAIKQKRIDLFFDDHADALEFGVQDKELYILED